MNLIRIFAIAFFVIHLGLPLPVRGEQQAQVVVEGLHAALLETMKDAGRLGYSGRYERLEPVIRTSFDLPFILRVTVGRYWKEFDDGQRADLVEKFSELSVATYASRFDDFSGEMFQFVSMEALKRGRVLIRTNFVKADGEVIHFDYILHQAEGQWRIINVIVDGVSDLSLKRAQYTSIVKNEGFGALLEKFNEKIQDYAAEGSD
jgi:phospholipid transport system substrate-binding protein